MSAEKKFAVIGAGHGGKSMAAHLALMGNSVNIFNRSSQNISMISSRGGIMLESFDSPSPRMSNLNKITSDIKIAIAGVDIIMVVVPSSAHANIATIMAPHLKNSQIIILNPGRTCGAIEFVKVLHDNKCKAKPIVAETQSLVYASRSTGPADAKIFSIKDAVPLAALPSTQTKTVLDSIQNVYPQFIDGDNVLRTGLDNIGAIFHPALSILNAGRIESTQGNFQFYIDGVTGSTARILEVLDRERITVAAALGVNAMTAMDWLVMAYDAKGSHLEDAIKNNLSYYGIRAPTTLEHRYISEEVPMSLVPISELGLKFGVTTRGINAIISLANLIHETDYRTRGRTLNKLGINDLSVTELKQYVTKGVIPEHGNSALPSLI